MAKKKWIKAAVKDGKGEFADKAKAAGQTTAEFAKKHEHDKGKLGKQARLAETLMKMHSKTTPTKMVSKMYGGKE